jgi:hypothetical protein
MVGLAVTRRKPGGKTLLPALTSGLLPHPITLGEVSSDIPLLWLETLPGGCRDAAQPFQTEARVAD